MIKTLQPNANPAERRSRRGLYARAGVAVAGLTLTACTSGTAHSVDGPAPTPTVAKSSAATCVAEKFDKWIAVPTDNGTGGFGLNADRIAQNLGVNRQAVAAGKMAIANCTQGVPVEDLADGVIVTLTGIPASMHVASRCLLIISDVRPDPGAIAHHIGGVCPAADLSAST